MGMDPFSYLFSSPCFSRAVLQAFLLLPAIFIAVVFICFTVEHEFGDILITFHIAIAISKGGPGGACAGWCLKAPFTIMLVDHVLGDLELGERRERGCGMAFPPSPLLSFVLSSSMRFGFHLSLLLVLSLCIPFV